MILVDSSVWIAYFRCTDQALTNNVDTILLDTCTCGIVMQEILQGVKDDREYGSILERFQWLPYVEAGRQTYLTAADIYRTLRKKGKTVLAADTLIAATAMENNLHIFTLDTAHFNLIAESFRNLKLYKPTAAAE